MIPKSNEGVPFVGMNTKIEPERAAERRLAIKKMDGDIARKHRILGRMSSFESDGLSGMALKLKLAEWKVNRAKLQAERAFIMEQANPKKESAPKPKKRAMRKSQRPAGKEATHETA